MDTSERRLLNKMVSGIEKAIREDFKGRLNVAHVFTKATNRETFFCNIFLEREHEIEDLKKDARLEELRRCIWEKIRELNTAPWDSLQIHLVLRSREEVDRDFGGDFYKSMY
jgi:hypothetical protein